MQWKYLGYLGVIPAWNLAESFVDNVFRDKAYPEIGSVLYCDLALGYMEHSGIYVGDGMTASLSRDGEIKLQHPSEFVGRSTAFSIYVSCQDTEAVGSEAVAQRAMDAVGSTRGYNFILDNCHQFTAGCLTGDFDNTNNFLKFLKQEAKDALGANSWRVWDLPFEELHGT